jgi:hypothetical protein
MLNFIYAYTIATFFVIIANLFSSLFGYHVPEVIQKVPISVATSSEVTPTGTTNDIFSPEVAKKTFFIDKDNLVEVKRVIMDGTVATGTFSGYQRITAYAYSSSWEEPGSDGNEIFIFATKDYKNTYFEIHGLLAIFSLK